jgi:hypothetical protein
MFAGQTVTFLPRVSNGGGGEENLYWPPTILSGTLYSNGSSVGWFVTPSPIPSLKNVNRHHSPSLSCLYHTLQFMTSCAHRPFPKCTQTSAPSHTVTEFSDKSKSLYDWRSDSQSVLVSSPYWDPWPCISLTFPTYVRRCCLTEF